MIKINKCVALIFCILYAFGIQAQDNSKYLVGAVPEIDGKVVFSKTIDVSGKPSASQIYSLMKTWVDREYTTTEDNLQNRILLSDPKTNDIACQGEDYLIFKRTGLVLDRAKIIYQLIIHTEDGKCDLTIRNIRYDYSDNKKLLTAEGMISDKEALNKNKTKLYRDNDKFRIHTVDMFDRIFESIEVYLNGKVTTGAAASVVATADDSSTPPPIQMVVDVAPSFPPLRDGKPTSEAGVMPGFKRIVADKLPGNIIKYLNDGGSLLMYGASGELNVMSTSWGGVGVLWDKPVAFCFAASSNNKSIRVMDTGDTYTISFYTDAYKNILTHFKSVEGLNSSNAESLGVTLIQTPSGATAFAEAWLVIECRKIAIQQVTPNIVQSGDSKNNDAVKMYIGEILDIWIK